MGSSKKTQTNKPIYAPQIEGAANTVGGVYNQNAPKIQGYADTIGGLIPSLMERYNQGNPAMNAAQDYITRTLGQTGPNPMLDQMISQTGNDVAQGINANLGTRGLTGGSVQQQILARELAKNATNLRYADFNNQQERMARAAGMAPGIAAGDMMAIAPLLSVADTASGLPMRAAGQYAGNIGNLLGQYQTTTQKSSGGLGGILGGILSSWAGSGFAIPSDRRLKTDIKRVGQTDNGLSIYTYRYGGEGPFHMGVMAQEVEAVQPEAIGPELHGFKTVNYAEVR